MSATAAKSSVSHHSAPALIMVEVVVIVTLVLPIDKIIVIVAVIIPFRIFHQRHCLLQRRDCSLSHNDVTVRFLQ